MTLPRAVRRWARGSDCGFVAVGALGAALCTAVGYLMISWRWAP